MLTQGENRTLKGELTTIELASCTKSDDKNSSQFSHVNEKSAIAAEWQPVILPVEGTASVDLVNCDQRRCDKQMDKWTD